MRPAAAGKRELRVFPPRSVTRQGVYMIMMFPIVVAVTLLLALGEVATNEARRDRFVARSADTHPLKPVARVPRARTALLRLCLSSSSRQARCRGPCQAVQDND